MESPGPDDPLGDAGEQEWARLRAQIELSDAFWLGFVFSPSPRSVSVLRERVERLLRAQTKSLVLVRPATPEGLREVLPYLLEKAEPAHAGCTWVEAVRADSPGAAEQPWTRAYDDLFLRMNERRDALRGRLKGGLVFAAPPHIKPRVREAAPDLWSVRSIVIELPAVGSVGAPQSSEPRVAREEPGPVADLDFALQEAARRKAKGAKESQARALMQAVPGLLVQERVDEARKAAMQARELFRGEGGAGEAEALAVLAEAEEAAGDPAAASDHIDQAIVLGRYVDEARIPLPWYDRAGKLALARRDLPVAQKFHDAAESIARERALHGAETPDALRNLSVLLERVGDTRWQSGDLRAAATAYEETLALCRRLAELRSDAPEALRDLSISLDRVGDVRRESGDLTAATAAYEESLALDRRLRELHGDTPETLRDLSISLDRVGNIRSKNGDLPDAATAYEEALTLRRRLGELRGDAPDALRGLSISLERVGDIRQQTGDLTAAAAAYEESLALRRRLLDLQGDTPEALRDLSISLECVGDLKRKSGDLAAVAAAYEESLTLRRRLREVCGDSLQALEDLAPMVARVAWVRQELGDLAGENAAREEFKALLSRLKKLQGKPPDAE